MNIKKLSVLLVLVFALAMMGTPALGTVIKRGQSQDVFLWTDLINSTTITWDANWLFKGVDFGTMNVTVTVTPTTLPSGYPAYMETTAGPNFYLQYLGCTPTGVAGTPGGPTLWGWTYNSITGQLIYTFTFTFSFNNATYHKNKGVAHFDILIIVDRDGNGAVPGDVPPDTWERLGINLIRRS